MTDEVNKIKKKKFLTQKKKRKKNVLRLVINFINFKNLYLEIYNKKIIELQLQRTIL